MNIQVLVSTSTCNSSFSLSLCTNEFHSPYLCKYSVSTSTTTTHSNGINIYYLVPPISCYTNYYLVHK